MAVPVSLSVVLQTALATIFVASTAVKLGARSDGLVQLVAAALTTPPHKIRALHFLVAPVEALCAVMLLVPRTANAGAFLAAGIGVVATMVLVAANHNGYRGPCGCFGIADHAPVGITHLVRSLSLLAVAAGAIIAGGRPTAFDLPSSVSGVAVGIVWLVIFAFARVIGGVLRTSTSVPTGHLDRT